MLQLVLEISLFSGALGEVSLPEIGPEKPFQAGLILEDFDEPVGVELLEILGVSGKFLRVLSRTLDPVISSITEGAEFFVTRSGKMLGKGKIESSASSEFN